MIDLIVGRLKSELLTWALPLLLWDWSIQRRSQTCPLINKIQWTTSYRHCLSYSRYSWGQPVRPFGMRVLSYHFLSSSTNFNKGCRHDMLQCKIMGKENLSTASHVWCHKPPPRHADAFKGISENSEPGRNGAKILNSTSLQRSLPRRRRKIRPNKGNFEAGFTAGN